MAGDSEWPIGRPTTPYTAVSTVSDRNLNSSHSR